MRVNFKQLFVVVLVIVCINTLLVYGVEEVIAKDDPLLGLHEKVNKIFKKTVIDDHIVYYRLRMIGDAWVEKDFTVYQFDKHTKKLKKKIKKFRKGLLTQIKTVISKGKAQASAAGKIIHTTKIIISPESDVFTFKPTPKNPCWVVWHEVDGQIILTVVDAVTGEELGHGISPPYEGLSFSGPIRYSPCNPGYVWKSWIDNAKKWFDGFGYPTTEMTNPGKSTVRPYIKNPQYVAIYQFGHGGSTSFVNHCNEGYEYIYARNVEKWMASINAKCFVFLGHCNGICSKGDGTFSYEYRKGSNSGTTIVGYCGMGGSGCSACWSLSLDWQNRIFSYINQGYTVHYAFTQATADYPACQNCVGFAGDTNYILPLNE